MFLPPQDVKCQKKSQMTAPLQSLSLVGRFRSPILKRAMSVLLHKFKCTLELVCHTFKKPITGQI